MTSTPSAERGCDGPCPVGWIDPFQRRKLGRVEHLGRIWTFLDLTPYWRQEDWEDSPPGWPETPPYTWWRRHGRYEGE
jgi:predicted dithiol-disulfide oxidoreductase (DUF899 family)